MTSVLRTIKEPMSAVTVRQANSVYYALGDNLEKVSDFDRSHLTKAVL